MRLTIGLCLLLAVPGAFAQNPASGTLGGYLLHERIEVDVPGFGVGGSDSSTGIGLSGQLNFSEGLFAGFEFQDAKADSFRIGGGILLPAHTETDWVLAAALVDKDVDDGFGVFGGVHHRLGPQLAIKGLLGYLLMDDFDGLELTAGGSYRIDRYWSAFTDLRLFRGNGDGGVDLNTTEFHIGAAYTLGF